MRTRTITFTATDDTTDEANETIIVTAGTAVNATNSEAAVTVTINDNDAPEAVTFALSTATIVEGSSTTASLTATVAAVSEQDITIPFTLTGSASADEYTVSVSSIVITAGTLTASATITAAQNDTEVEVMETIIFNFVSADFTNGTTETTEITLNLQSDDNPEVSSIAATGDGSFEEGTATTVTMTLTSASSTNVTLPVTISGTATEGTDYTTAFPSLGTAELVLTQSDNYGDMNIHSDGRLFFIRDYTLRVHTPSTGATTEHTLTNYYGDYDFVLSGNIIYARTNVNGVINKIDITDLSAITETTFVPEATNAYHENSFSFADGVLYYNYYNYDNNLREFYTKTGDADPVLLYTGSEISAKTILFNNRLLLVDDWRMSELVDGVYTIIDNNNPNINNKNNTKVYNGKLYSTTSGANRNSLVEIKPPAGGGAGDVTFETITIENTSSFNNYVFSGATLLKTSNESGVYNKLLPVNSRDTNISWRDYRNNHIYFYR